MQYVGQLCQKDKNKKKTNKKPHHFTLQEAPWAMLPLETELFIKDRHPPPSCQLYCYGYRKILSRTDTPPSCQLYCHRYTSRKILSKGSTHILLVFIKEYTSIREDIIKDAHASCFRKVPPAANFLGSQQGEWCSQWHHLSHFTTVRTH